MIDTAVLREVPGILSAEDIAESAAFLAALQLPSGLIDWTPGGHADPWNHVEAAMALTITGHIDAAKQAYQWLARSQSRDGSWFHYYVGEWVSSRRIDTNVCAYIATGLLHYLTVTGDLEFVRSLWPTLEQAINFVVARQRPDGALAWCMSDSGSTEKEALLTGSSSAFLSLRCALELADILGHARSSWQVAAARLGHTLRCHPTAFADKNTFAMDWYYPVLAGVVRGSSAAARIDEGWTTFVRDEGVRCVHTNEWVTAAETAECVLALDAVGDRERARALFATTTAHRVTGGGYLTGWVYPQHVTFPTDECTSYSVAAVLLAADAITGSTPGAALFRHTSRPAITEVTSGCCEA